MAWRQYLHQKKKRHRADTDRTEAELLAFGYACRLFVDEERFQWVAEQRHLIPHQQLMIDRYDCRLHLQSLDQFDSRERGEDAANSFSLTAEERAEEELCERERYQDLYAAEERALQAQFDEVDEMKRGAGAEVAFSYDAEERPKNGNGGGSAQDDEASGSSSDDDEPFVPAVELKVPQGTELPRTVRENAVIEKTAAFVAAQGAQMEIVIKARQGRTSEKFDFMNWDHRWNPYYKYLLKMIREKKYTPPPPAPSKPRKKKKERQQKPQLISTEYSYSDSGGEESDGSDHYLHPALSAEGGLKGQITATDVERANEQPLTSERTTIMQLASLPTVEYRLGEENDVYSELYRNLAALRPPQSSVDAKEQAEIETAAATETEAPVNDVIDADAEEAPPPSDYATWYEWFYGVPPAYAHQPPVIPAPPDLAPVVTKTAEFVARFGAAAEYHLRDRTELQLGFLQSTHPYYGYYQIRLRCVQWDYYTKAHPDCQQQQYMPVVGAQQTTTDSGIHPQQNVSTVGVDSTVTTVEQKQPVVTESVTPPRRKRRVFTDTPQDGATNPPEPISFSIAKDDPVAVGGGGNTALGSVFPHASATILSNLKVPSWPPASKVPQTPSLLEVAQQVVGGSLQQSPPTVADIQRMQERRTKAKQFLDSILSAKRAERDKQLKLKEEQARMAKEKAYNNCAKSSSSTANSHGGAAIVHSASTPVLGSPPIVGIDTTSATTDLTLLRSATEVEDGEAHSSSDDTNEKKVKRPSLPSAYLQTHRRWEAEQHERRRRSDRSGGRSHRHRLHSSSSDDDQDAGRRRTKRHKHRAERTHSGRSASSSKRRRRSTDECS